MKMVTVNRREKSNRIFSTVQFIRLKLNVHCEGTMLLYKAMFISFNNNEFQLSLLKASQIERLPSS